MVSSLLAISLALITSDGPRGKGGLGLICCICLMTMVKSSRSALSYRSSTNNNSGAEGAQEMHEKVNPIISCYVGKVCSMHTCSAERTTTDVCLRML